MKRIFLILLALALPSLTAAQKDFALVRTTDGKQVRGEVLNRESVIEWRKDIYEAKNSAGELEKFLLKPENKGRLNLREVSEILRINPTSSPDQYATLSDGTKARLVSQYLVRLLDGRSFFISDFITLEHYYIDLAIEGQTKRIYLSYIRSLRFETVPGVRDLNKTAQTPGTKIEKKKEPAAEKKAKTRSLVMPDAKGIEPGKEKAGYEALVMALLALVLVLLALLLLLYLSRRSAFRRKKQRHLKKHKRRK